MLRISKEPRSRFRGGGNASTFEAVAVVRHSNDLRHDMGDVVRRTAQRIGIGGRAGTFFEPRRAAMYRRASQFWSSITSHIVPRFAPAEIRSIIVPETTKIGGTMSVGSIEQKLELARQRERTARAKTTRLRRELDQSNRRTRNQVRYTLGAAMVALAESGKGEQLVASFRRWLDLYLSRPADRALLRNTPFAVDAKEAGNAAE